MMPLPSLQVFKGLKTDALICSRLLVCASSNSEDDVITLERFAGSSKGNLWNTKSNGGSEKRQTQNSSCRVWQANTPSRKKWLLLPCDGGNLETNWMKYLETRKFNRLIPVAAVPPNLENWEYQERGPYNISQINDRAPPFLRHPGKKASRCPSNAVRPKTIETP